MTPNPLAHCPDAARAARGFSRPFARPVWPKPTDPGVAPSLDGAHLLVREPSSKQRASSRSLQSFDLAEDWAPFAMPIDCANPHDTEMFARVEYPSTASAPHSGCDSMNRSEIGLAESEASVGTDFASSGLDVLDRREHQSASSAQQMRAAA